MSPTGTAQLVRHSGGVSHVAGATITTHHPMLPLPPHPVFQQLVTMGSAQLAGHEAHQQPMEPLVQPAMGKQGTVMAVEVGGGNVVQWVAIVAAASGHHHQKGYTS